MSDGVCEHRKSTVRKTVTCTAPSFSTRGGQPSEAPVAAQTVPRAAAAGTVLAVAVVRRAKNKAWCGLTERGSSERCRAQMDSGRDCKVALLNMSCIVLRDRDIWAGSGSQATVQPILPSLASHGVPAQSPRSPRTGFPKPLSSTARDVLLSNIEVGISLHGRKVLHSKASSALQ